MRLIVISTFTALLFISCENKNNCVDLMEFNYDNSETYIELIKSLNDNDIIIFVDSLNRKYINNCMTNNLSIELKRELQEEKKFNVFIISNNYVYLNKPEFIKETGKIIHNTFYDIWSTRLGELDTNGKSRYGNKIEIIKEYPYRLNYKFNSNNDLEHREILYNISLITPDSIFIEMEGADVFN